MKKFVAMMVLVTLMMAAVVANAELRVEAYRIEVSQAATLHDGTTVWDQVYYAKVTTDTTSQIVEVSENEFNKLMEERNASMRKNRPFLAKVTSVLTFWDWND